MRRLCVVKAGTTFPNTARKYGDFELLPDSATDRLFRGLPPRFSVHVTHSQTVLSLPPDAISLAANSFDRGHAIRIGSCAWGVQFHPEYDTSVMRSYIEEQAQELEVAGRGVSELCLHFCFWRALSLHQTLIEAQPSLRRLRARRR